MSQALGRLFGPYLPDETTHCCFIFSVKTGAHLIGILSVLGVVLEIYLNEFSFLRFCFRLIVAIGYIPMVFEDNGTTRGFFLITWVIWACGARLVRGWTNDSYHPEFVEVGR